MSGRVAIVGLGPGPAEWMTPEASAALAAATDLVGYGPYLERLPLRRGPARHASDNRVELERARHALALAAEGRAVAVVSGGDPGVFAMAAAVFEAIERASRAWRALDIAVAPGVTRDAGGGGAARRAARPRFLRHLAVGQSEALGDRRAPAAARRRRAISSSRSTIPPRKARPTRIDEAFDLLRDLQARRRRRSRSRAPSVGPTSSSC